MSFNLFELYSCLVSAVVTYVVLVLLYVVAVTVHYFFYLRPNLKNKKKRSIKEESLREEDTISRLVKIAKSHRVMEKTQDSEMEKSIIERTQEEALKTRKDSLSAISTAVVSKIRAKPSNPKMRAKQSTMTKTRTKSSNPSHIQRDEETAKSDTSVFVSQAEKELLLQKTQEE